MPTVLAFQDISWHLASDNQIWISNGRNTLLACDKQTFLLSIFLPKYKYYCSTLAEQGRTYLAVMIHSIGWKETITKLLSNLRINNLGFYLFNYLKKRDHTILLNQCRKKKNKYKRKRCEKINIKIKEENKHIKKENKKGIAYGKTIE